MDWIEFQKTENSLFCIIDKNKIPKIKQGGLPASLNLIRKIEKNYTKPFTLLCSGGVDSQAMAYAWKLSGVEHNIILFEYTDYKGKVYNDHDLKTFYDFAKENNIKYTVKQINYFEFLENDLLIYAKTYDCASPQITCMIKMIESIGTGTIILSGNMWNNFYIELPFTYDILALHRFSKICKNFSVIPFFFLYDIELATGFKIPEVESTTKYYDVKCSTYIKNMFPIIPQDKKFSGFEQIKEYFETQKNLISYKDKLRYLNKESKSIFDIKFRYMIRDQLEKEPEIKIIVK